MDRFLQAVVWVFRCRKPKKTSQAPKPVSTTTTTTTMTTTTTTTTTTELSSITVVDQSASFDPNLKFSMTKLRAATKDFSPKFIIGDGSFGTVYKAKLSNGVTVAIKRLNPDAFKGFREFWAEMVTLGMLHHPNIVKILGYCMTSSDRLLIYEFFQKGSLDQCLHLEQKQDVAALSWGTRIQIIKGVANGLSFLHSLDKPIAHQNIKSRNVFLDSDFQAHITDFGLARGIDNSTSYASTQSADTMGYCYMPPEYKEGLTSATLEADVYSFGILMFEIATGKRPNLPTLLDGKAVGIVEWARKMLAQKQHMEMVDTSSLREDGPIEAHVKQYFEIAANCTDCLAAAAKTAQCCSHSSWRAYWVYCYHWCSWDHNWGTPYVSNAGTRDWTGTAGSSDSHPIGPRRTTTHNTRVEGNNPPGSYGSGSWW